LRINKFLAQNSGISRREADVLIQAGRVKINGKNAVMGQQVELSDSIFIDENHITLNKKTAVLLNKPTGYVCSRNSQGNKTIYNLLPEYLHHLKPAGRLDKDSSGVLVLTDDGEFAQKLTHPKYLKEKAYKVTLDRTLTKDDVSRLSKGIELSDGVSKLQVNKSAGPDINLSMREGRNRQIRRTFEKLGYQVTELHRYKISSFDDNGLKIGQFREIPIPE
jgi:23S rRNA pseudouridine2605 synthase